MLFASDFSLDQTCMKVCERDCQHTKGDERGVFLLPNNSIAKAKDVPKMSIKQAGYTENEVRDLVAANIGTFFPGLMTIATEFSRWEDSTRRLDILAIDTDRNLYVIEFKRDNDAAHAELQALRYAAMLSVCQRFTRSGLLPTLHAL